MQGAQLVACADWNSRCGASSISVQSGCLLAAEVSSVRTRSGRTLLIVYKLPLDECMGWRCCSAPRCKSELSSPDFFSSRDIHCEDALKTAVR